MSKIREISLIFGHTTPENDNHVQSMDSKNFPIYSKEENNQFTQSIHIVL